MYASEFITLHCKIARSYSPPARQGDYSLSPRRRHPELPRSPRGPPPERSAEYDRMPYSPGYDNAADRNHDHAYVE